MEETEAVTIDVTDTEMRCIQDYLNPHTQQSRERTLYNEEYACKILRRVLIAYRGVLDKEAPDDLD